MKKLILFLSIVPCLLMAFDQKTDKEILNDIIARAEKQWEGNYFMINRQIKLDVEEYHKYILMKKKLEIVNGAEK